MGFFFLALGCFAASSLRFSLVSFLVFLSASASLMLCSMFVLAVALSRTVLIFRIACRAAVRMLSVDLVMILLRCVCKVDIKVFSALSMAIDQADLN